MISSGNVLSIRDQPMPSSLIFEAEMELLELLEYKPILSKGYTCMMHIHTFSDEVTVKDLIWSIEKHHDTGEEIKKDKPKFTRSFTKVLCRISSNKPIPLEKASDMPSLGRFTLRDEGKTIAVGKVMKYKPYKEVVKKDIQDLAQKLDGMKVGGTTYNQTEASVKGDVVFNLETGQVESQKPALDGIAEGEEDDN